MLLTVLNVPLMLEASDETARDDADDDQTDDHGIFDGGRPVFTGEETANS